MVSYYKTAFLTFNEINQPEWESFVFISDVDIDQLHITVPTYVIWGEDDQALKLGCLKQLDQYVTDLKIEYIPNAGHFIIQEQPERINEIISNIL